MVPGCQLQAVAFNLVL